MWSVVKFRLQFNNLLAVPCSPKRHAIPHSHTQKHTLTSTHSHKHTYWDYCLHFSSIRKTLDLLGNRVFTTGGPRTDAGR